jgi:hypothetical protein
MSLRSHLACLPAAAPLLTPLPRRSSAVTSYVVGFQRTMRSPATGWPSAKAWP